MPFCEVICHYCDFYTARNKSANHEELFRALHLELESYRQFLSPKLKAIYFGGGTPGLSPASLLTNFLSSFSSQIDFNTEITLEVNPSNANEANAYAWRAAGINRLSMGIQSLRDDLLKRLGRNHDSKGALQSLKNCLSIFDNVSGDLIYGVPGQSDTIPAEDAERLADLGLHHISAYHLSLAQKHFLFTKLPSDQAAYRQIELLATKLQGKGFAHYEISNFTKGGKESRNNQNYWLGGPYLALGPSAHGYDGHALRWYNIADWREYCAKLFRGESAVDGKEWLGLEQRKIEYLFTRLRLLTGINLKEFELLFGSSLLESKLGLFEELQKAGLGSLQNGYFVPSFQGRMLGDELVRRLL